MQKNLSLMVRLDETTKSLVTRAAEIRRVSVSDYVRSVMVSQAQRDVAAAETQSIAMTPDEQRAFWQALAEPPTLTKRQKQLASLMRGDG